MLKYKKCCIFFLCLVLFNPVASWSKRKKYRNAIRQLIDLVKRRSPLESDESILDVPDSEEDLPEAEPIHPGHTLLKPSLGMLESSIKYPLKDAGNTAVYGNLNNLGITYGKTNNRVLYTGFRKANDVLIKLLQALNKKTNINKKSKNNLVIIRLDPSLIKKISDQDADISTEGKNIIDVNEILDDPIASPEDSRHTRRQRHPRYSAFRQRIESGPSIEKAESSSESESSDYEHNLGNPYTVHKEKYKQNWLWNHFMDGNHMNVNPYAPPLNTIGPSGAQLFFGRKWWYFNQDDFKPLN